jgi:hypothetical protein
VNERQEEFRFLFADLPASATLFLALATTWADGRISARGVARAMLAASEIFESAPDQALRGLEVARRSRVLRSRDPDHGDTRAGRPATTKNVSLIEALAGSMAPSPLEQLVAAEDARAQRALCAERLQLLRSIATPAERRALRRYWRNASLSETDRVPLSGADRVALHRLRSHDL